MAAFFDIKFERVIPGVNVGPFPALASAADDLQAVARKLEVLGVWDFYETGTADRPSNVPGHRSLRWQFWKMIGILIQRSVTQYPPAGEIWCEAAVGVTAVELVRDYVRLHPTSLSRSSVQVDEVLEELDDLQSAISTAKAAGVRFHLLQYT